MSTMLTNFATVPVSEPDYGLLKESDLPTEITDFYGPVQSYEEAFRAVDKNLVVVSGPIVLFVSPETMADYDGPLLPKNRSDITFPHQYGAHLNGLLGAIRYSGSRHVRALIVTDAYARPSNQRTALSSRGIYILKADSVSSKLRSILHSTAEQFSNINFG